MKWKITLKHYLTYIGKYTTYLYSRRQEHEHRASAVLFEQSVPITTAAQQVLVPVANPATTEPLMELASRLAVIDSTHVTALHVVGIPEQLPYTSAAPFAAAAMCWPCLSLTKRKGLRSSILRGKLKQCQLRFDSPVSLVTVYLHQYFQILLKNHYVLYLNLYNH